MANNTGNIIVALVAGAAVGIGVGMLLAPEEGSKTREKIKDGFKSSKDDLFEKLSGFMDGLQSVGESVVSNVEEILEKSTPKNSEEKESLITLLEEKLAALKNEK